MGNANQFVPRHAAPGRQVFRRGRILGNQPKMGSRREGLQPKEQPEHEFPATEIPGVPGILHQGKHFLDCRFVHVVTTGQPLLGRPIFCVGLQ